MFPRKLVALAALCSAPTLAQSVTPSEFFRKQNPAGICQHLFRLPQRQDEDRGAGSFDFRGLRQGAASGSIISKDDPEKSRLLEVLRYQGATKDAAHGQAAGCADCRYRRLGEAGRAWPETTAAAAEQKKSGKYEFTAEQRAFWRFSR